METLQRTANRGSISTGFNIDNSLKLEPDNSERIQRAHGDIGTPTNQKIVTISFWMKRTELLASGSMKIFEGVAGGNKTWFGWNNDRIKIKSDFANPQNLITTRVFRDTSAWYHIVVAIDTSQGTAANRVKLYINGVQETDFSTESYPNQNNNSYFFESNMAHYIGGSAGTDSAAGYWADFYLLDGQVKGPTDFGEFDEDSGIWTPIAYAGDFGDEGYHIDFKNSAALGADVSGNSNNFGTLTNVSAVDQATDTPTNNFATINTLPFYNQGTFSFPNGATNIKRSDGGGDGWTCVFSTIAVNKGKWYAEMEVLESPSLTMYGYASVDYIQSLNFPQFYLGTANTESAGYYSNGDGANDAIYEANNFPSAGVQSSAGTIIGIAIDCDNNKIHFSNNGTYTNSSNPVNNTNGFPMPDDYVYFAQSSYTGAKTYKTNLGGYTVDGISSAASDANGYGTFEYAPPSGYYALCTKNLAEYG